MNKQLSAATKTKQYQQLIESGLKMVSTERQLENGTIALTGKVGRGRKATRVNYAITANGAVLSNEFVARRVTNYREGLTAVQELLSKRTS
jgi:RecB family endonuclease NucS